MAETKCSDTAARLANADSDRLDALEEAELATEDRDGYRRELARVRAQVRELEGQLRAERHEHAETREALKVAQYDGVRARANASLASVMRDRDRDRDCLAAKASDLAARLSVAESALAEATARAERAEHTCDLMMAAGMALAAQNARLMGVRQ